MSAQAKRVPLGKAIARALIRRRRTNHVVGLVHGPVGPEFLDGPYYENRAMRRARGDRGYSHGLGAKAPSLRTRGR